MLLELSAPLMWKELVNTAESLEFFPGAPVSSHTEVDRVGLGWPQIGK